MTREGGSNAHKHTNASYIGAAAAAALYLHRDLRDFGRVSDFADAERSLIPGGSMKHCRNAREVCGKPHESIIMQLNYSNEREAEKHLEVSKISLRGALARK